MNTDRHQNAWSIQHLLRCSILMLLTMACSNNAQAVIGTNFTVVNTNDSGPGSLRQALIDANLTAASDKVLFAFQGAGPHVIAPNTPLPAIVNGLTIDGYSQSGASVNTQETRFNAVLKIQLSGALAPSGSTGLRIQTTGAAVVIRGLSITGFGGSNGRAIEALSAGAVSLQGCAIGVTTVSPAIAAPNQTGIDIGSAQTGTVTIGRIGATALADRNVISGNTGNAIVVRAAAAGIGATSIDSNLIGVSFDGEGNLPNGGDGVQVSRSGTSIRNNTIKGNFNGLSLNAANFVVTGNHIGVGGQPSLLNSGGNTTGISILGGGIIGGAGPLANFIAGSSQDGIEHSGFSNADYSQNRFFRNGQLAIDIRHVNNNGTGDNGTTANDPSDPDTGPNGVQNKPLLASATRTLVGGPVTVFGTLNSLSNRSFRLTFYGITTIPANSELQFLGDSQFDVTTDASGNASFGPLLTSFNEGSSVINLLSASATLIDNVTGQPIATSELATSIPIQIAVPVAFTVTSNADPGNGDCNSGGCTLREAIVAANNNSNALAIDDIRFAIPGSGPHSIILASPLPTITQPVTIDGYTQAGATVNTDTTGVGSNAVLMIALRPTSGGIAPLDGATAAGVTLRGLSIHSFTANGAIVFQGINTRVEGNWFGVQPDGTDAANTIGLRCQGAGSSFGGDAPAQRNIWSSNQPVRATKIINNLFGVLPDGRTSTSLAGPRAHLAGVANGETLVARGNIFSTGVDQPAFAQIQGSCVLEDNSFGESADGQTLLSFGTLWGFIPEGSCTIRSATRRMRGASLTAIRFDGTNFGNLSYIVDQAIEGGAQAGISLSSTFFKPVSILSAIRNTVGLGIDLGATGVDENDLGDGDFGPNLLTNFPVLISAERSADSITVSGTLNASSTQRFRISICGIASAHVSGHGGCDEVLDDATEVVSDAQGNASFSIVLANNPAHQFVTATASLLGGLGDGDQTSEYALNIPITEVQDAMFANDFE
jgi:trimeric autotransporter adhesin